MIREATGKLALGALLTAGLFPAAVTAQDAGGALKIAVVDIEAVAAESPAGRALQARLAEFQEQTRTEGAPLLERTTQVQQEIAAAPDSLTAEQQSRLERAYQDALTAYNRFTQDKRREAQQIQAEGLREVEAEIAPILQAIQEEENYDLVLKRRSDAVILISERIDITRQLIDRLNAAG